MKARSPFETPENLWTALTWSRQWRLGMQQAESDNEIGTIRLENMDAAPEG